MRILAALLAIGAIAAEQPAPDPRALTAQARELLRQPTGRPNAEVLLKQAAELWDKQTVKTGDTADTLILLAMTIHPALAQDKAALATQVEPLVKKALDIRQKNPDTKPAEMALALEFQAMILEELGRIDDSREPKSRARALRDQIILAMQPPPDFDTPPEHMGNPGVIPPRLISRAEPESTFEARVLKLQGDVMADVVISADGQIHQVEMYHPAGFGLDENAAQALMKWRFLPATKNGVPVPVEGNVRLRFH